MMNYFIVVSPSFSSNESEILKTTRVTLCDKNEGFHLNSLKRSQTMEERARERERECECAPRTKRLLSRFYDDGLSEKKTTVAKSSETFEE